jgi:manganese/zinc/iron transport system permease protein
MEISILITAILLACTCALLGSFLIHSRQAMMADAISHAVLPGIVIAYLISNSRGSVFALLGAAACGILITLLVNWLKTKAKMSNDSAIGLMYTSLFALGVFLITRFTQSVDLDQECVLFGDIAYVHLDRWYLADTDLGPRALYICSGLLLFVGIILRIGYRNLSLFCFNPEFAQSIGISIAFWNLYLLGAVSITTVMSFELVGAILIIALLILPASSGYLLSKKLKTNILLALIFSIVSCIVGYAVALQFNLNIAACVASVAACIFFISFLLSLRQKNML